MPLHEISAEAALKNLRTRTSIWPQRGRMNRKGLLPLAEIRPTFQFGEGDKFFCMGSCFAQHIGGVLSNVGFDVVTHTQHPYGPGHHGGSNHLIRYNIHSILNDFRWALGEGAPYEDGMMAKEENNLWMDPFGHCLWKPHTIEEIHILRDFTASVTRRLKECRIVIITLGLVEVWYDRKYQKYVNLQPGRPALREEPDRYVLRVLNHDDIIEGLEAVHSLLSSLGHPDFRMLLTTSPVPLHATFRQMDVFTANCYSKSVQRGAIDEFLLSKKNVDYFPSYEAITLGNPDVVWKDDQRHVNDIAVSAVMEHVLRSYAPDKQIGNSSIEKLASIEAQLARYGSALPLQNILGLVAELNATKKALEDSQRENAALKAMAATTA